MGKFFYVPIILIIIASIFCPNVLAATAPDGMEAVWMATVFNIDFPSVKNDMAAQKAEFINKLNELQATGINTVVVQVRPSGDALYKSNINPWSAVLTGTQGQDPGYDPLAFMITEAHKRGMAFHAWLNPYRITTSGTDVNELAQNHPARLHPNWVINYNNSLYYNPDLQEVRNHIVATVEEIIDNYDVDAIHFDDYFYPANYPLPAGESKDGAVAQKRIENVNEMVKQVSLAIRNSKKDILFGISPMGIWKNYSSDPTGSLTNGAQSYYRVYGDTRSWIKNEWIDYVVPQIYWETGNKAADYETLVKWWANEVKGTSVKLYIGHGVYKSTVSKEIDTQLKINSSYSEVAGNFYYGLKSLLANSEGCRDKILAFNQLQPLKGDVAITSRGSINSTSQERKKGQTTASVLNIRTGNGLNHAVITKVPRGSQVEILASKPGWYNVILSSGQIGWASADYVKILE